MSSVPASTPIPVPSSIRETARRLFAAHLDHIEAFPKEAWFSLSSAWHLELYVDEEAAQCRAKLHPAIDDEANVQISYPVFPPFSASTLTLLFFALRRYRDYDTALGMIEENLLRGEYHVLAAFLTWVKAAPDHRNFAEATFPARFGEWENTLQEGPSC